MHPVTCVVNGYPRGLCQQRTFARRGKPGETIDGTQHPDVWATITDDCGQSEMTSLPKSAASTVVNREL